MIGSHSPSQPSQQLVWMVEVVVFSNGSDQDLVQSMLDVELRCDAAAVFEPELHLELAIHQPIQCWFHHHQKHSILKPSCMKQCSSTCLDQSLPLNLERLKNSHQRQCEIVQKLTWLTSS